MSIYNHKEELRAYQQQRAAEFERNLKAEQQAEEDFKQTEEYKREQHEAYQDLWERKAKKEGWKYTRAPYVSALDRQRLAEQRKQEEIAALQERIKQLENE